MTIRNKKKYKWMRWIRGGWVPLVYTALTLVMTYPAFLHLGDRVMGSGLSGGEDVWIIWWTNWWVKRCLSMGKNVYFTRHLFFPYGVELTYHSFSWLNTALWLLLEPLLGQIVAYNLTVLWVFPLAGWGMERLVHELTGSKGAAFLAGLVFAFVPYRIGQSNHPTLMGTQWLPFFTLFLLRSLRSGRWRHILLASLFLILTALVSWNLFLYLVIWTACIGGYALIKRLATLGRLFGVLTSIFFIGGLFLSPFLVPMLIGRFGAEDTLGTIQQDIMQTDLLAYVLPNRYHPLWGEAVDSLYRVVAPSPPQRVVNLGYIVIALLIYGLLNQKVRRQTWLWYGATLFWWFMALGPYLKFNGHVYHDIPLPYYPLSHVYFFQLLKIPDRYNLMLSLPVAVIVGYTAADMLSHLKKRIQIGGIILLSTIILFEYLSIPMPIRSLQIPAFYQQLAQENGKFGIAELPIDFFYSAKQYMLYQTLHGHPIIEGHVSRRPPEATTFLDTNPLLNSLYYSQEIDPSLQDISRQLRTLQSVNIRYIIIHRKLVGADRVQHWQRHLLITPRFEDGRIAVFSTTPQAGRDFVLAQELAPGIGPIRVIAPTDCLNPGQVIEVDIGWGTTRPLDQDMDLELALVSAKNVTAQAETFCILPGWPTSEWPANTVAWGYYPLRVDPSAAPGTYTITMALIDSLTGQIQGQPTSVEQVTVRSTLCSFPVPSEYIDVNALFGDELRLLGYQLHREGTTLIVRLLWRSERRPETDYKIFVHVFDPATTVPAAQDDAMPHRWAYPTTFWAPGEVVDDLIPISLKEAPPGTYKIAVGVYDPVTLERLPVAASAGQIQPNGRLVLSDETIQVED